MRRVNLWLAAGAAVVVALAAAACARDASAPDASAADAGAFPAAAAVVEGASVRAMLIERVEVPGSAFTAPVPEADALSHEATVLQGAAVDPATGAVLALTAARGVGERDVRFADDEGHQHRIRITGLGGRGPVAHVRYERDGEPIAEIAYRWDRRDGGFVLRERTLTLTRGGRVILRHVRATQSVEVASAPDAATPPSVGGLPPIQFAQAVGCLKEWIAYGGASVVMIVAGEAFTMFPNTVTFSALMSSVGLWERALGSLIDCQMT
jgi:hypothetical protein